MAHAPDASAAAPADALGEFELIARHFQRPAARAVLGVGDDCALLQPVAGQQWAVSTDMLVEGRHFLAGTDARRLGHKALAVNLSDLAAMGAQPHAFLLALALPAADPAWLREFAAGLFALADEHGIELVGGDTTRGPLNLCLTVLGLVPAGAALRRDAARAGDDLWVSGVPGEARLALGHLRGEWALEPAALEPVLARLERPTPRVALGLALRGIAHAAIDVSDGLLGDLGHVLRASGVGAEVLADALPRGRVLAEQPEARRRACQLAGGDDYELLFTAPAARRAQVLDAAAGCGVQVSRIGSMGGEPGLRLLDAAGRSIDTGFPSFDHFATP
ncbi:MAG: thiamine-phosphate kinase [Betaproteobacteria bacterium]|nr:thiamine-phosphate kinase [Betaproteobacteria bacterium]MBU6511914.1 thiamine-phosphate kinase [Betaproteobacteria bacterium]MDE1954144.1 thiamine-phosphate kinase [Betaproteobacteria bacterium]MDE2152275.1 thiamine-phosphate kinase [Betaproteobacteria bacterium]MDE2477567.1 thiamine-phosphate kinase [Betaproteobacteria bacterium]